MSARADTHEDPPDPARPPLRDRNRERVREEIAAAAHRLFLARGFQATSVEDIAHEAGVSARTVYRHFPSKEDVIFHRHRQAVEAARVALAEVPASEPAFAAIDDAVGRIIGPFVRETMPLLRREPVLIARLDELTNELETVIADFLITRGDGDDRARTDALLVAGAIAGTMRAARRTVMTAARWDPTPFARAWELLAPLAPERHPHDDGAG